MILLIDNYDSFVHNLARYMRRLGAATHVVRNDAITCDEIQQWHPDAIVLSPGPCTPREAGCCLDVVRNLHGEFPILGVCLGHQAIAAALGGEVIRASRPMHGRRSAILHDGCRDFAGIPSPFAVGRYHSLVVDGASLPDDLEISARTSEGVIMAVRHRTKPVFGWQFHPESILTEHGFELLSNFLRIIDLKPGAIEDAELIAPPASHIALPKLPVTF